MFNSYFHPKSKLVQQSQSRKLSLFHYQNTNELYYRVLKMKFIAVYHRKLLPQETQLTGHQKFIVSMIK